MTTHTGGAPNQRRPGNWTEFFKALAGSASALVLLASAGSHVGNYLYYVIGARIIGTERFADLASLIGLATIMVTPFLGVQAIVARDVGRAEARNDPAFLSGYLRSLLRKMCFWAAIPSSVLLACLPLLHRYLGVQSSAAIALTGLWMLLWIVLVTFVGVAQGAQRFGKMAFILVAPQGLLRPLLLPPLAVAFGVAGGIAAMALAAAVGVLFLAPFLWSRTKATPAEKAVFEFDSTALALIGFAILTNIDLLVARNILEPTEASNYSAAALLGKIALFAPSALTDVMLPRMAVAKQSGQEHGRIAASTLAVTLASGLLITCVLWLAPSTLTSAIFGSGFESARRFVGPLALVMTGGALINVYIRMGIAIGTQRLSLMMFIVLAVQGLSLFAAVEWLDLRAPGIVLATGLAMLFGVGMFEFTFKVGPCSLFARAWTGVRRSRP